MKRFVYYLLWVYRTVYYLGVLAGLLYLYGFVDHNPKTNFIYNGF